MAKGLHSCTVYDHLTNIWPKGCSVYDHLTNIRPKGFLINIKGHTNRLDERLKFKLQNKTNHILRETCFMDKHFGCPSSECDDTQGEVWSNVAERCCTFPFIYIFFFICRTFTINGQLVAIIQSEQ